MSSTTVGPAAISLNLDQQPLTGGAMQNTKIQKYTNTQTHRYTNTNDNVFHHSRTGRFSEFQSAATSFWLSPRLATFNRGKRGFQCFLRVNSFCNSGSWSRQWSEWWSCSPGRCRPPPTLPTPSPPSANPTLSRSTPPHLLTTTKDYQDEDANSDDDDLCREGGW